MQSGFVFLSGGFLVGSVLRQAQEPNQPKTRLFGVSLFAPAASLAVKSRGFSRSVQWPPSVPLLSLPQFILLFCVPRKAERCRTSHNTFKQIGKHKFNQNYCINRKPPPEHFNKMRCSKLRYYSDLELASTSKKSTKTSFSMCPEFIFSCKNVPAGKTY